MRLSCILVFGFYESCFSKSDTLLGAIIVALGFTAIVMTLIGGSWAATAGDFVQMLVLSCISIVMAVLCLWHPQIGGPSELVHRMPAHHFDWTQFDRPWIIAFFFVFLMVNQTVLGNSILDGASKYVFVKNGREAKRSVLIPLIGFLIFSPLWLIPAVTATVVHPNLGSLYPALNNPNEAAYVAMAIDLLPKGLLGLMVCAILAASMTTLNSGLNVVSGTFVRNFYIRVIDRGASESRQILVGRLCTLVYGTIWILVGLKFASLKGVKLFDLLMVVAGDVGLPAAVPLFLGMFVRRTPAWTGWSTMLVGFLTALALQGCLIWPVGDALKLTPVFISGIFHPSVPFGPQEIDDLRIALTYGIIIVACSAWFFLTTFFYKHGDSAYVREVDLFFKEMNTPINLEKEHGPAFDNDVRQYRVLGNLCLVFGGFILLLLAVPNTLKDRLLILLIGGFIVVVGVVLRWMGSRLCKGIEGKGWKWVR